MNAKERSAAPSRVNNSRIYEVRFRRPFGDDEPIEARMVPALVFFTPAANASDAVHATRYQFERCSDAVWLAMTGGAPDNGEWVLDSVRAVRS